MRKTVTLLASIGVLALAAIVFSGSFSSAAGQGSGPSGYHVIKTVPVGGEGFWDYLTVDSEARRLYISHGTHVQVMDIDTYALVGDIPDTQGVHGIALAPELGRGFTSNGGTNTVTIFDLKTLKTIGRTKAGKRPDAIVYDPASRRVFAFNGDAASATVIEAATGNVAGTIQLGGEPEFAVADGEGHIYDNLEDLSMVLQIDSRSLKVTNRWPLAPCKSPSSMAIDKQHRRLFVGCANRIMAIMDADSGRVVATTAIGDGVDANRFDPETNYAFASNGDGTLTVVHEDSPDKFSVVENVTTRKGARTLALDERTHKIFLATTELGPMVKGAHWPPAKPGTFVILVVARESPRQPADKTTLVFGQTIHYFDVGSGPVVVLVHGLGSRKEDWLPVLEPLSQKYRLLVPDQIGFGKSDKPLLDYSVQTYVDFLNEFLRQLKVEKASLVGESLGGWIAALYAVELSGGARLVPVEKMVLVDAAGLKHDTPSNLNPSTLAEMRGLMEEVFYDTSWLSEDALRKIFTDKLSAHDGYTVHSLLSNPVIATERLDDRLGSIKTPTLVIWGKQDKLVPLSSGERYAAGIAGAKLVTFEKCGHAPPVEKTEEFVGTVTAFLGSGTAVPAH